MRRLFWLLFALSAIGSGCSLFSSQAKKPPERDPSEALSWPDHRDHDTVPPLDTWTSNRDEWMSNEKDRARAR
jgi:hypothetical protein